ncbi:MAG: response regulator [Acidimicrobiales bacterium]
MKPAMLLPARRSRPKQVLSPHFSRCVDVLVVDDNEDVRLSCAEVIASAGYSTMAVCDADEAMSALGSRDISMMVLDVQMPHLDGLSMLSRIDDPPPVILLTGSSPETVALSSPAIVRCLQKPVSPLILLDLVRSSIGPAPPPVDSGA